MEQVMVGQDPHEEFKKLKPVIQSAYEYCSLCADQTEDIIRSFSLENLVPMIFEIIFEEEIEIIDIMGNEIRTNALELYVEFLLKENGHVFVGADGRIFNESRGTLIRGIGDDRKPETKYLTRVSGMS